MTFDEIMDFGFKSSFGINENEENFKELIKYIKSNAVVPFIGAGMSMSMGYPGWGGFLESFINDNIDGELKEKLLDDIKEYKYEEVAEDCLKECEARFKQKVERVFSNDKLNGLNLYDENVAMLPYIFDNVITTTNFDPVLEKVYDIKYDEVTHPGNTELLNKKLRGNEKLIFKFHGSAYNWETIIFTKTQYDEKYIKNPELVKNLEKVYSDKIVLFLGCSLNADRTIDVLNKLKDKKLQYAIIGCRKEEKEEIRIRLKNINVIFYEVKDNNHDGLKVLLETMLREINPKGLEEIHKLRTPKKFININKESTERFRYDSSIVDFVGREKEIEEINKFVNTDDKFKWWFVSALGGTGKTRLAYEYKKQMSNNMDIIIYDSTNKEIEINPKRKTLYIIDYTVNLVSDLAKILTNTYTESIKGKYNSKIRILILVQNMAYYEIDDSTMDLEEYLAKYKNGNSIDKNKLKESLYKNKALILEKLDEDYLKEIARKYINYFNEKAKDEEINIIISTLSKIDNNNLRVLYLLFICDAFINLGKEELLNWNKTDILDYIYNREIMRIESNFDDIDFISNILAYVTAGGNNNIDDVYELYTNAVDNNSIYSPFYFNRFKYNNFNERLQVLGFTNNEEIKNIEPDIVGEYFFLKSIKKLSGREKEILFSKLHESKNFYYFLERLANNFQLELDDNIDYILNNDKLNNQEYYILTITNIFSDTEKIVKNINDLYGKNYIDNIIYVKGLVNISAEQQGKDRVETINKIEKIYKEIGSEEIAIAYAKGLVNISAEQQGKDRVETIKKIEKIYKEIGREEIAIAYAKGLYNISLEQQGKDRVETIKKIEKIYKEIGREEIAIAYAKGLYNISVYQQGKDSVETIKKIEKIYKKIGSEEIAVIYAYVLFNISIEQQGNNREETINKIEKIYKEIGSAEIAIEYAKGLFNISVVQKGKDRAETIKKIEKIYKEIGSEEIAIEYAKGLFNISVVQKGKDRAETIKKIEKIYKEIGSEEIAILYAKGLVNISAEQQGKDRVETINKIEKLYKKIGSKELAIMYAYGLFNITIEQEYDEKVKTNKKVEKLYKENKSEEMAIIYAKGLYNLILEQEYDEKVKTNKKVEKLYKENKSEEMAIIYAKGLVNLSLEQKGDEKVETIEKLEKLHKEIENEEIKILYSYGLANLSKEQQGKDRVETINKIEKLYKETKNKEILDLLNNIVE